MSPPVITQSSESYKFSAGSAYDTGFSNPKNPTEKSHISSRSRPRLMKMRRQMPASQDGKTVKTDLRLNGVSDVSGEKDGNLRNFFGVNNRNSDSNENAIGADLNGNMEQRGSGLEFGVSLSDSFLGLRSGNGKSLSGSSVNGSTNNSYSKENDYSSAFNNVSSTFDAQKETESLVFGARTDGPTMKQTLPDECFVYGPNKNGLKMDSNSEDGHFVFGVGDTGSSWKTNISEKDTGGKSGEPKVGDFQKFNNVQFVFGSDNYGVNVGKSKPGKVSRSTTPDVQDKVKLGTSEAFEKVCNPFFQFPSNWTDSSNKKHGNCTFGIDFENKPAGKVRDTSDFRESGKENAGLQSKNACLNGVFVFRGLKGKGSLNYSENTMPFSDMNRLNRGKVDRCNGFGQHNHNSCSDNNSKFQNSGGSGDSFEKDPAFSILNEMKRLNICDPKVDAKKSGNSTGNFSVDTNNMFVFGGNQKSSDIMKDNHPTGIGVKLNGGFCEVPSMDKEEKDSRTYNHPRKGRETPDVSCFSHNNSKSNLTSSCFFPSAGIGVKLNGGFCEVPSMDKEEKDSRTFSCKLDGLNSSNADNSTPNMKFDFSFGNLRSLGSKKSQKRNGKLRQKTMVQQLFSQNHVSKEGNAEKNEKSPGCGSPMDFSPYQDTSASNAPDSNTGTGVTEEFPINEKHIAKQSELHHDERSSSSFPPVLAQDGLTDIRRKYKKKYKLKIGSNPTAQRNNLNKDNSKQESSGSTVVEVCEHWRIRGNEAYHAGQLSKAEEFYTMGLNSVPHVSITGHSIKSLLLCYSNRAATRMSLGRMREAIGDCTKASELDPDFLKAALRAGNCYLVLGEVDDAIRCYKKCLSSKTSICLDRRVTIEAADGLQKANEVAEHLLQSAKVLQEGTEDAASRALGIIQKALLISRFSERLLEMKGEALHMLRRYDEVIQLCKQTLDASKKNFFADLLDNHKCKSSHAKLWRWNMQTMSYYSLGKLDLALDLIEKQEKLPISSKPGYIAQESSISLAANIHELLSLKKSGNEAFNSGKYTDAIENYTAAISKSFESRGFMAICFCNRAAAFQSLSQIVDAISDCSVAIALDEKYLKAISRRATLHEMIRDYKQAVYDLEQLVSLLESHSQIKSQGKSSGGSVRDLRKAHRRLSLAEEMAKKESPLDLYLILGIKASDSEAEIKKAYRKAALRHHPDKAGQVLARNDAGDDGTLRKEFGEKIHKDADRLFKIIGEAYAVLSDPSKRSKYDDEEETRKIYRESARNSNSGHPSTSYSSPYERGRPSGFSTSFERNSSSRRYWYSHSHSRW